MPVLPDVPHAQTAITTAMLLARLRDLISEESEDFYDDDAEALVALNEGRIRLFADLHALPATFTASTVNGTATLAAPADLGTWARIKCGGEVMRPLTTLEYTDLEAESGRPDSFTQMLCSNGVELLLLHPTPDAVYAIDAVYFRLPPELTDAQGPTWHERFAFLPCLWAASILAQKDHLPEIAQMYRQQFEVGKVEYERWLNARLPYRESETQPVPKQEM